MVIAVAALLYLAIALGVAAELVDRRRPLGCAALVAATWPFFAGLALGAAMVRVCER